MKAERLRLDIFRKGQDLLRGLALSSLDADAFIINHSLSVVLSEANVEVSHVASGGKGASKGDWVSIDHISEDFSGALFVGSGKA